MQLLPPARPRLVTHAVGDAQAVLDLTAPVFAAWAEACGYDLVVDTTDQVGPDRSPHWNKPVLLRQQLATCPAVLWVDPDLVLRHWEDPAPSLPADACMGLCLEQTEAGIGPNTGFWYLRHDPDSLAFLDDVIARGPIAGAVLNDQARVAERLGFTWAPAYLRPVTPQPILARTGWFDGRWNMLSVYHPEARWIAKGLHVGGLPLAEKLCWIRQQIIDDRLPGWDRLISGSARTAVAAWSGPMVRLPAPAALARDRAAGRAPTPQCPDRPRPD